MVAGQQTGNVGFGAPILAAGGLLFTASSRSEDMTQTSLTTKKGKPSRCGDPITKATLRIPIHHLKGALGVVDRGLCTTVKKPCQNYGLQHVER